MRYSQCARFSKFFPDFLALAMLCLLALAPAMTGCTRKSDAPSGAALPSGQRLMQFDFEAVRELTLVKSDPTTGDAWSAHMKWVGPDKMDWELTSGPHDLIDRKANGPYIRHLLDTLRTLSISEEAPKGPAASFGLEPPRFALRWDAGEVRIGSPTEHAEAYAVLPTLSPGRTYKVKGAALQMLSHLENFEYLRRQTFPTFGSDDVFEIEIKGGGKAPFYAQREGETWTDRKHRKLKKDAQFLVDQLSHARIKKFVDDGAESASIRKRFEAGGRGGAPVEIVVANHKGDKVVMKLARADGKLWGTISTRPDAHFELFPKTLEVVLTFL